MAKAATRPAKSPSATAKRAVNLSVRADLVEDARQFGTNLSALLERALLEEHKRQRIERWREENHEAIVEANEELARNGLWSDRLRLF